MGAGRESTGMSFAARRALGGGRIVAWLAVAAVAAAVVPLDAAAVTPPPMPTYLSQFGGPATAAIYPWGIAALPDGTLVVTDYDNHAVKHLDLSGNLLGTYGSEGPGPDQFNQPYSAAVDPAAGAVYVSDPVNARFLAFSVDGAWLRTTAVAAADLGTQVYNAYLAVGPAGEVVTESAPDTLGGSQASWPQRVLVYDAAGNPVTEFGVNGTGPGQFKLLRGVGVDAAGDIYAADSGNRVVDVFSPAGGFLRRFGVPGTGPGQLGNDLRGLTVDPGGGFVYVVDASNGVAHQYTLAGRWVQDIGRPAAGQQVVGPRQLAVDGGSLCLTDYAAWRVACYSGAGAYQLQVPDPPQAPPAGGFNQPAGLAVDATAGLVYVTDTFNQRVEEFTTAGAFQLQWGSRLENPAAAGSLDYPRGVSVDPATHVAWVTDTEANIVKAYDSAGNLKKVVAGPAGSPFFQPQGALGAGGRLFVPDSGNLQLRSFSQGGLAQQSVACGANGGGGPGNLLTGCTGAARDSAGNLYLASPADGHVYKFSSTLGLVATFGGAGSMRNPYSVAVAGSRLYVCDAGADRVLVFNLSGALLGSFGSAGTGNGQFLQPRGVGVDASGLVYVLDSGNDRVEVFHP